MNFVLFIALNAVLFVRPQDLLASSGEESAGSRIYMIVIILCLLTTFQQLLFQFKPASLFRRPITCCVIGMLLCIQFSKVVNGYVDVFDNDFSESAKVVLYFLLLMALIDTPERILTLMGWLVLFVVVLSVLGSLQYHDVIDIPGMKPVEQSDYEPVTGNAITIARMCSLGIFSDPNDFCLILTAATICCRCRSAFASSTAGSFLWNCPIVLFFYAVLLTKSRGGLLGLMAGVIALFYARFGWKRSIPLSAGVLGLGLALVGGRQANINASGDDTSGERIRLWSDGLDAMTRSPVSIFAGIGVGGYAGEFGLVAHNSFVQAYVETGVLGGTLFLGAFYLGAWGPRRANAEGALDEQPALAKLQPFVFALTLAYAGGIFSLSRVYTLSTLLTFGWGGAFMAMAYPETPSWFCFNKKMVKRLCIVGVVGFVFLRLFTRTFVQH
jgi:putative inorganic carbon (hco3(-)) transporter